MRCIKKQQRQREESRNQLVFGPPLIVHLMRVTRSSLALLSPAGGGWGGGAVQRLLGLVCVCSCDNSTDPETHLLCSSQSPLVLPLPKLIFLQRFQTFAVYYYKYVVCVCVCECMFPAASSPSPLLAMGLAVVATQPSISLQLPFLHARRDSDVDVLGAISFNCSSFLSFPPSLSLYSLRPKLKS